jgi:hypothetical protein
MQTRAFDTADKTRVLRTVIGTLQDLGYAIDKVEPPAGTVTATKLSILSLTVAVHPRGTRQTAVRANAMVRMARGNTQVDDPAFYQRRFFEPLSKALFLSALQVEDADEVQVDDFVAPESGATKDSQPSADETPPKPPTGYPPSFGHGP